jgi:hypothetical protein
MRHHRLLASAATVPQPGPDWRIRRRDYDGLAPHSSRAIAERHCYRTSDSSKAWGKAAIHVLCRRGFNLREVRKFL